MLDTTLSKLLTVAEAAAYLRVSRSLVYRMTEDRRLPFLKVGGRTLIPADALADWVAGHVVAAR